jgi:Helix-turn-helix domain
MRSQAAMTLQAFDGVPTDQAATYLGCTASTLKTYRSRKKGPAFYRGVAREVLYKPEDLDAWLRSKRIDPTDER